jgi:hypothetical protein
MHPASPMRKWVEEGSFVPMTDDEIVSEIRLLVSHLEEMHSYFSCADFSLNLLMQVDGYLDEKKDVMLAELDKFLSLTKKQKQVYTLLRRASFRAYPIEIVYDQKVMDKVMPEVERLEKGGEDGFNKYIQLLMSHQLPQPQTENWT